nr:trans-aconitate 3-methyltransferase [Quercus suber]
MIKQANSHPSAAGNTEYREGSAETGSSFLAAGSVDCVTAGQAVHWFDYARFWPEMARIVRPGGTCAFWGYKDHVFVDFPRATATMQHYAYDLHPDLLGSYWTQPGRGYVQDKLRVVQPPVEDWEDVQRLEYEPGTSGKGSGEGTLFMERRVTVGQCKEYVRTWSSYHGWQETHPDQVARSKGGKGDVMDVMFDEIAKQEPHFNSEENEIDIEWGSALIMARRK